MLTTVPDSRSGGSILADNKFNQTIVMLRNIGIPPKFKFSNISYYIIRIDSTRQTKCLDLNFEAR